MILGSPDMRSVLSIVVGVCAEVYADNQRIVILRFSFFIISACVRQ